MYMNFSYFKNVEIQLLDLLTLGTKDILVSASILHLKVKKQASAIFIRPLLAQARFVVSEITPQR